MSDEKRVRVSLRDFLRVTVAERERFDSHEAAANELGLTVGSFKQRLSKERKAYPDIYADVPGYRKGSTGPRRATADEAMAILAELQEKESADNATDQ